MISELRNLSLSLFLRRQVAEASSSYERNYLPRRQTSSPKVRLSRRNSCSSSISPIRPESRGRKKRQRRSRSKSCSRERSSSRFSNYSNRSKSNSRRVATHSRGRTRSPQLQSVTVKSERSSLSPRRRTSSRNDHDYRRRRSSSSCSTSSWSSSSSYESDWSYSKSQNRLDRSPLRSPIRSHGRHAKYSRSPSPRLTPSPERKKRRHKKHIGTGHKFRPYVLFYF